MIPYRSVVGATKPRLFKLTQVVGSPLTIAVSTYSYPAEVLVDPQPLTAAWSDEEERKVLVTGGETLPVGSYILRFKVTDALGKYDFVPSGQHGYLWIVYAVGNK